MAANPTDAAIAQLDLARARRIGQMLVTKAEPEYEREIDQDLLDVTRIDGKTLCEEYEREMAVYATTPFDPDGRSLRLYPHGLTIWSGFPGAGKTTLLRQLICHLLQRDNGVFVASLEEHPKHVIYRLAATAAGQERPTPHQVQWFIDVYGERLRVWGRIGLAKHRVLLGVIRKLGEQGVTHAVIDSLMKLDIDSQDYEAQRVFANQCFSIAQLTGTHIHLVAHPKKPPPGGAEPDLNDVAGAKEIGGVADNVLFVRRKPSEAADPNATIVGMQILVRKQRHGTGAWPTVDGYFNRITRQFQLDSYDQGPVRYLPAHAYEA